MLQTISKHIQGWISWVIIIIIAAAFVFWGLEYYISRGGEDQTTVATVNGAKITSQQLNNAYEAFKRNYSQQGVALNEPMQNQLRNIALQQLILDEALLQRAEKMGLSISSLEVQQVIWHIPDFQVNDQFSPEKLQQALNNNGVDQQNFIQRISSSLLVEQLSAGVQKSSFVTASELARAYDLLRQQRDVGYFILPAASFTSQVQPSDAQLNAYYQQHQDQFRVPEQVKVSYILLSPEILNPEIKISPAEISQYYQDNPNEFKGKSLAESSANIETRLRQQKLNQTLAAKSEQMEDQAYTNPNSLEPVGKNLGLKIETSPLMSSQGISNDPIFSDPKVLAAVFSDEVSKQNNNSRPIELKNGGFIVLRIAERQQSKIQPLAEARDTIIKTLQKEQNQKQLELTAYQIQHSLESGKSVADLANTHHLTWNSKAGVTRQDQTLPAPLLKAIFSVPANADPAKKTVTGMLMADGNYAIIQVDKIRNAEYNSTEAGSGEFANLGKQLAIRWGEVEYQLFLKSILEKAEIKNKLNK